MANSVFLAFALLSFVVLVNHQKREVMTSSLSLPSCLLLTRFHIALVVYSSEKNLLCHTHKGTNGVHTVLQMVTMLKHYANTSTAVISGFHCLSREFELLRRISGPYPLNHEYSPIHISLICLRLSQCGLILHEHHNISKIAVENVKTYRNASTVPTVPPLHVLSAQFRFVIIVLYLVASTVCIRSHLCQKSNRDRIRKSSKQEKMFHGAVVSIGPGREKYHPELYLSGTPLWKENTNVLHDIIHHLWRFGHPCINGTDSHASVTLQQRENSECRFSSSTLCSDCKHHIDSHLRRTKDHSSVYAESKMSATFREKVLFTPSVIHVYPVTRFLPDPTRNPHQDLAHVGYRLATLSVLPAPVPVSRIRMADAGFYSRGVGDEVTCYSCHVRHSGWTADDNPMEVHRRLSPTCAHVLQSDGVSADLAAAAGSATAASGGSRNIDALTRVQNHQTNASAPSNSHAEGSDRTSPATNPGTGALASQAAAPRIQNNEDGPTSSTRRTETSPSAVASMNDNNPGIQNASSERANPGPSNPDTVTVNGSSVTSTSDVRGHSSSAATNQNASRSLFPRPRLELGGAVYPMYQAMNCRRTSFPAWDETRAPPLMEILLSGMFYAGYLDCVRCFYCGVGLKNWVATDDVWTEHVRWRPECGYLRAVKGDAFITAVQRRLSDSNSESSVEPNRNSNSPQTSLASGQGSRVGSPASASRPQGPDGATAAAVPAASGPGSISSSSRTAGRSSSSSSGSNNGQTGSANASGGARATVRVNATNEQQTLAHLQAENRTLTRTSQCMACQRAPVNTLLLPCGHLVVCETCARSMTSCPLCSERVRATTRVYFE